MWWIILIIVGFILFRFFSALEQDKNDLNGQSLDKKFSVIVHILNDAAYGGRGKVTTLDTRSFNLYERDSNQIFTFLYGTGHLTITYRYKLLQKEARIDKQFTNVRNISLIDQEKIATTMLNEVALLQLKHSQDVYSGLL